MVMRLKTHIILFIFSICVWCGYANNDIFFHKISVEQGLSQFSVNAIYQDEFGILWFGTREGINRFNGNSIDVLYPTFDNKNAMPESIILNLCGDKNGHIYVHSLNGVTNYNLQTSTFTPVYQGHVDRIAYGNQNLLLGIGNKLHQYTGGKMNLFMEIEKIKSGISWIMQASDNRIYIGTISSGVFVLDNKKQVKHVINDCSEVSYIFEDDKKRIWISTLADGIYKMERDGSIVNYHTNSNPNGTNISSNDARTICQDNNGSIWIGTYKGLNKLNSEKDVFTHYGSEKNSELYLSNESVWSLLKDAQGTIWVGTYFGGINYFNPDVNFYTFHDLQNGIFQNKPFPVISHIIEYDANTLFLCTEGNGLIYYNLRDRTYKVALLDKEYPTSIFANNIKATYYDSARKELWIGTHLGGVYVMNTGNRTIEKFPAIKPDWPKSNIVHAIIPYGDKLLIGTQNGLFVLDKTTKNFSLFSPKLHEVVNFIQDIKIDKNQRLWIASNNGLYRYNLSNNKTEEYHYSESDPKSISHNNATKLLIDSKDRVWIATAGGGANLFDEKSNSFVRYNKETFGLINNYVSNLCESFLGKIILSTTKGLAILDVENNALSNLSMENGFPINSLYNGGMNVSSNGELYIAGMDGLISFFEEDLNSPHKNFKMNLVNLWVNNTEVIPNDKTGILKKSLLYTDKIRLSAKQRMLTVEFASDNYIQANYAYYRYKLEGFSDTWTELLKGSEKLSFMNLSPGKYRLVVEGILRDDASLVDSISLFITISPPIYNTWYAYLLYSFLIGLIIWRLVLASRAKLILKTSLDYEKKEKENLEKTNQSKLRFFTNISHEFRTPLTLIRSQIDMLLQMHDIKPVVFNRILSIDRNTYNMQNLIDELLAFNKSEQGHLKIRVSQYDLIGFIYEIYLSFLEFANTKKIQLDFESNIEKIDVWFDNTQLQKVLNNLISNAFKYTKSYGKIKIQVNENTQYVYISIIDNGIGISSDEIDKIFDRFYQAENGVAMSDLSSGTGIGLALTKSILELHSAEISVESELDKGSRFTVKLRKGLSHFSKEQLSEAVHNDVDSKCVAQFQELDKDFINDIAQSMHFNKESDLSILIVEDNKELCFLLKNAFEPIYKVYTAFDGEEGLAMTIKHQPDIVLTDLMMPKMSGSELCAKIKNNFSVCHIPVVLLTAQTAIDQSIEGLRLGADDYITKPFNLKTLITRCNNLVNNRKILQEKFSNTNELSIKQLATNSLDRDFLEKAYSVIENHLDNDKFDVTIFSQEMALGRTNLFRKIKGITGKTPNEFIVTVRLQKAVSLFNAHPEYSIAEVSYMVGFSSAKYFGKCFKAHFGISPSEYRKE